VLLAAEPAGTVLALALPAAGGRWRKALPAGALPAEPPRLSAWAFDAEAGRAHRLCGPPPAAGAG
jgi:hypothetical protein